MTRYILQLLVSVFLIAVLVLWPAGTLAYAGGWSLIALFGLGGLVIILWLARVSPSLLRERMSSPVQKGQARWDQIWLGVFIAVFCGWLAFMGWDAARTGFHAVPVWLQVVGGLGVIVDYLGTAWTFRENAFAAPVVKLQEHQKVIDTGPYAIVRHPMYTSAIFLFLGIPLLLGSWPGLIVGFAFILALAWRSVHEERTLRTGLAGYDAYAARVRYRLIPGVW